MTKLKISHIPGPAVTELDMQGIWDAILEATGYDHHHVDSVEVHTLGMFLNVIPVSVTGGHDHGHPTRVWMGVAP